MARELRNEYKKEGYNLNPVSNLQGFRMNPPTITGSKKFPLDNKQNIFIKDPLLKPSYLPKDKWLFIYISYRDSVDACEDEANNYLDELLKVATK